MQNEEDIIPQLDPAPASRDDESMNGEVMDLADKINPIRNSATQNGNKLIENLVASIYFVTFAKTNL